MKIAITGATGFIARHCIKELLAHDYELRGTVRNLSSIDKNDDLLSQMELVEVDLLRDAGWDKVFEGVDAVLHTASPVIIDGTEDELIKPALEGTRRVLENAAKAGVKRIVLTSSTAAIVNTDADIYDEECWSNPEQCSPYPKSKTLAERAAWDYIDSLPEINRPELVVCNPCVVFGELLSDTIPESVTIIQKLMERSIPAIPDIGFSIVNVKDVAVAHRLALETADAAGHRFLLRSEFFWLIEISEILEQAFSHLGYRPQKRRLSYPLVWFAAFFHPMAKAIKKDIGVQNKQDNSKAINQLGWNPGPGKTAVIEAGQSLIDRKLIKPR